MNTTVRLCDIKEDLVRTAAQLDTLCQALAGHARYLERGARMAEVSMMHCQVQGLVASAQGLRSAAAGIR